MKLQVLLLSLVCSGFGLFAQNQPSPPPDSVKQPSKDAANATFTPANDVVKMANAGIEEKAIVAFVNNSPGFKLNAEDVITLHQRGLSTTVINAMLQNPAKPGAVEKPVPPPAPKMATVTTGTGPNPPIIYPTPAKEAVPLTDPVVVTYPGSYAGGSSVLIVGSPYSYAVGQCNVGYGAYCGASGFYNCGPRSYGGYRGSRWRF